MLLPTVVGANNHAVALLQRGQYALAVEKLREAQSYAKLFVRTDESGQEGHPHTTTNHLIAPIAAATTSTKPTTISTDNVILVEESSPSCTARAGTPGPSPTAPDFGCLFAVAVPTTVATNETETFYGYSNDNHSQPSLVNGSMDAVLSPHNVFSIYDQAFVLWNQDDDVTDKDYANVAVEDYMTVGAIPLYNTALALHLYGMSLSGHSSSSTFLRHALYLYKLAIAIVDETSTFAELHEYPLHLQLLLMAAYSNAGHIHSHFMDDDSFLLDCQHHMQSLYTRVSPEVLQLLALPINTTISMTFVWNSLLPSLEPDGRRSLAPAA